MASDNKHIITQQEAEDAVRKLLLWIGEDPDREGLKDTPLRLLRAYEEFFAGYKLKAEQYSTSFFEEVAGYKDPILIRDIPFYSHCEHHMVPIIGKAHIAYYPDGRVIGLSKIPRLLDIFAKRLQTQEALTAQIAQAIMQIVKPKGVACLIEAEHMCMAMRGVKKQGSRTITSAFKGCYELDSEKRQDFMAMLKL